MEDTVRRLEQHLHLGDQQPHKLDPADKAWPDTPTSASDDTLPSTRPSSGSDDTSLSEPALFTKGIASSPIQDEASRIRAEDHLPSPSTSTATTPVPAFAKVQQELVTVVGDREVRSDMALSSLQQLYLPVQEDAYRHVDPETKTLSFPHQPGFPAVKMLPNQQRKRILVTGGAGFVGSHLVDRLMLMGHEVIVLDNFFTGSKRNVQHWLGHPHFELIRHDVVDPFMIEVDQIYHLACPASPPHYQYNPIKTVKTSVMGTINMLGLAKRTKARFLLTSTSGNQKAKAACHMLSYLRVV